MAMMARSKNGRSRCSCCAVTLGEISIKEKDGSILSRNIARQVSESCIKEGPGARGVLVRVSTLVPAASGGDELVGDESTPEGCIVAASSSPVAVLAVLEVQSSILSVSLPLCQWLHSWAGVLPVSFCESSCSKPVRVSSSRTALCKAADKAGDCVTRECSFTRLLTFPSRS